MTRYRGALLLIIAAATWVCHPVAAIGETRVPFAPARAVGIASTPAGTQADFLTWRGARGSRVSAAFSRDSGWCDGSRFSPTSWVAGGALLRRLSASAAADPAWLATELYAVSGLSHDARIECVANGSGEVAQFDPFFTIGAGLGITFRLFGQFEVVAEQQLTARIGFRTPEIAVDSQPTIAAMYRWSAR